MNDDEVCIIVDTRDKKRFMDYIKSLKMFVRSEPAYNKSDVLICVSKEDAGKIVVSHRMEVFGSNDVGRIVGYKFSNPDFTVKNI